MGTSRAQPRARRRPAAARAGDPGHASRRQRGLRAEHLIGDARRRSRPTAASSSSARSGCIRTSAATSRRSSTRAGCTPDPRTATRTTPLGTGLRYLAGRARGQPAGVGRGGRARCAAEVDAAARRRRRRERDHRRRALQRAGERCSRAGAAAPASRVGTVDKFQGQEADVVALLDGELERRGRPARPRVPALAQPPERRDLAGARASRTSSARRGCSRSTATRSSRCGSRTRSVASSRWRRLRRAYSSPVSFAVAADAYDRFMGRYSVPLAPQLADLAGSRAGQRVLDVGCGPGALTAELVAAARRGRGVGGRPVGAVRRGRPRALSRGRRPAASAEQLPFADDAFDAALAQLVVHFMADPVAGSARWRASPAGTASSPPASGITPAGRGRSACSGRRRTSSIPTSRASRSWRARARATSPSCSRTAGLRDVEEAALSVTSSTRASRSGGSRSRSASARPAPTSPRLDAAAADQLRERCRELLPEAPFVVAARAWAARGLA